MVILLIIIGFISNFLWLNLSWIIKESNILEYGYSIYPQDRNKIKKELQKYNLLDRFLLLKLVINSKKKIYAYLLLINHWLIIMSILISFISFFVFLINKNEFNLELFYSMTTKVTMITALVEFIPDIIFVKSIRKRYSYFDKKESYKKKKKKSKSKKKK